MVNSERFARLRLLLGDDGLERLWSSRVMVLGLGGVGSSAALALARGGVGALSVLDEDVVSETDLNRQTVAFVSTLGRAKSEVMAEMIHDVSPDCRVDAEQTFLSVDGLSATLDAHPRPDYVLDCIDTVTQKLVIAQWCAQRDIPLLASMGAANKLDPCHLRFADLHETVNCRLSIAMRKQARRRGIRRYEVLFSDELAAPVSGDGSWNKAQMLGSMSYMPPIMGQMMAGLVMRRLAGLEPMGLPPLVGEPMALPRNRRR